jgi:hypothetical protein
MRHPKQDQVDAEHLEAFEPHVRTPGISPRLIGSSGSPPANTRLDVTSLILAMTTLVYIPTRYAMLEECFPRRVRAAEPLR